LLIGSTRDVIFDLLERSRQLIPQSKIKIIEDAGVLVCFEKPQEFAQALLDFMQDPSG
jgi:pimeloyl-ACP methyl ester carboxylesterase